MTALLSQRVLIFHKQSTSGRLRFLRLAHGTLLPTELPESAKLCEPGEVERPVRLHPGAAVRAAERALALDAGALAPEADFEAWIALADGDIPVVLAACTSIDPPFAAVEAAGGRFIAITEARGLPQVELDVLRRAYEHILG